MKKILLLPILLISLVSCEKETTERLIKISLDTNGGSAVSPIYVKQGRALTKDMEPKPSRSGFEVSKWTSGFLDVKFDGTFFVSSDLTLKAEWKISSGGGASPEVLGEGVVSNVCKGCHGDYATRFKGDKSGAETVIDNIGVSGSHASRGTSLSDSEKTNAKAYINSL